MMPPSVNEVLREGPEDAPVRLLRVLWHSPDRNELALFDLEDPKALPFWMDAAEIGALLDAGELVRCVEDPCAATIRRDSDLSATDFAVRDRRLAYVSPLVEDARRTVLDVATRTQAVSAHVKAHGGSSKGVYHLCRLWWRGGQLPNALVPAYQASALRRGRPKAHEGKRGRPRAGAGTIGLNGIAVTAELAARMAAAGKRYLKQGMSLRKAYVQTLLEQFSDGVVEDGRRVNVVRPDNEIPSIDQFHYHVVGRMTRGEVLLATGGETRFARKNRARPGAHAVDASGPGSAYQMDATVADIYLRSHENPDRLIGRPVLYIVIDVYSRMIVGFSVGLSGPSWEVGKLALENAMTEKVGFCAAYGVEITEAQWPSRHVPARLTCDRGSDMMGVNAAAAAKGLGYELANLPPYRPDWKGLVESRFHLIHDTEVKWAPGASHGRERGERKTQLDAVHTLRSFTELMILFVLNYNRSFEVKRPPLSYASPDGRTPSPIDLWNHGILACGAPRLVERDRVRANLMHVGRATETDKGLRCAGLHYMPADPAKEAMFLRVPGRKWASHEVRTDPRDVSTILLPVDHGNRFEVCRLSPIDRRFEGWTAEEVHDFRAMQREGARLAAPERLRAASDHQSLMADLNRRAEAASSGVRLTPASASGIRAERRAVNRSVRADEAWTARDRHAPPPVEPVVDVPGADATAQVEQAPLPAAVDAPVPAAAPQGRMAALRAMRELGRGREDEQ